MRDTLHQASALRAGELLAQNLKERHPAAWALLCFHSFLHPVRVPGQLVARHLPALGPQVRAAVAALPGPPEHRAQCLLEPLFTHSFLQRLHDTFDYAIRPEVAVLVRDELPPVEFLVWLERTVVVIARESRTTDTALAALRLLPHARELVRLGHQADVPLPEFNELRAFITRTAKAHGLPPEPAASSATPI